MRPHLLFTLLAPALPGALQAQAIHGRFDPPAHQDAYIRLHGTRGTAHPVIDSARVDGRGAFSFAQVQRVTGFYQLSVNDSDRVDLILDQREPEVVLILNGSPLQDHVLFQRSVENQRLWEYKAASREAQALIAASETEKGGLDPLRDLDRIHALDSIEAYVRTAKQARLAALLAQAPESFFAKVVAASQRVEAAQQKGPMAVARGFDLSDPSLLRSSAYPQAVMTFLRNLDAVSEEQFVNAADTLMHLASGNAECRSYMLEQLLELFATYGPDMALRHLVDRYLEKGSDLGGISKETLARVREAQRMTMGAMGPDIPLPFPGDDTTWLSAMMQGHPYTLLFFYSSTCDHCHAQMPGVVDLYERFGAKGLQVVGVAIDESEEDFHRAITDNHLTWPCFSELRGWGSPAAKAYAVQALPSFFLLAQDRRIVGKPYDAVEAMDELKGLLK
ncbi:MAG: TlpA family protein disulfide reductase [Flavobacteriales bacterium]|nr:TlpA family protein disulfide reductase [Flavobacteriales bacterium]MCB9167663.1 TlpA family protein disulfide reductase [Flavobacteriales bacterium]